MSIGCWPWLDSSLPKGPHERLLWSSSSHSLPERPVDPKDETYMQLALELAQRGRGWVNPNPMVGAVVVRDGEIVGTGFHAKVGSHHAEVMALAAAGDRAQEATLYVTLEPCNHHGRTPPCTPRVVAAGIRRVVIASMDPNPLTTG
ncbi:MAG: bifunctional diaminohydroxyphosphoribosylaminopyrimidine deaminase/5-amino-6-(5-phosphoribosylamino)uracil reductase RibD, partial [Cyanobacteria bacterium REEB65]|nr:bifunctional diaminohydroxyphosphoribosylaminopyrimidine deaminase/5-amino-6-(5-phosphoribosylamino)uracil reductase RibD [Cyanobacteria bacterium REEB65]